jgi:hypothetical protein
MKPLTHHILLVLFIAFIGLIALTITAEQSLAETIAIGDADLFVDAPSVVASGENFVVSLEFTYPFGAYDRNAVELRLRNLNTQKRVGAQGYETKQSGSTSGTNALSASTIVATFPDTIQEDTEYEVVLSSALSVTRLHRFKVEVETPPAEPPTQIKDIRIQELLVGESKELVLGNFIESDLAVSYDVVNKPSFVSAEINQGTLFISSQEVGVGDIFVAVRSEAGQIELAVPVKVIAPNQPPKFIEFPFTFDHDISEWFVYDFANHVSDTDPLSFTIKQKDSYLAEYYFEGSKLYAQNSQVGEDQVDILITDGTHQIVKSLDIFHFTSESDSSSEDTANSDASSGTAEGDGVVGGENGDESTGAEGSTQEDATNSDESTQDNSELAEETTRTDDSDSAADGVGTEDDALLESTVDDATREQNNTSDESSLDDGVFEDIVDDDRVVVLPPNVFVSRNSFSASLDAEFIEIPYTITNTKNYEIIKTPGSPFNVVRLDNKLVVKFNGEGEGAIIITAKNSAGEDRTRIDVKVLPAIIQEQTEESQSYEEFTVQGRDRVEFTSNTTLNLKLKNFVDDPTREYKFRVDTQDTDFSIISTSRVFGSITLTPLSSGETSFSIIVSDGITTKTKLLRVRVDLPVSEDDESLDVDAVDSSEDSEVSTTSTDPFPPKPRPTIQNLSDKYFLVEEQEDILIEEVTANKIKRVFKRQNRTIERTVEIIEERASLVEDEVRVENLLQESPVDVDSQEVDSELDGQEPQAPAQSTFEERKQRAKQVVQVQKTLVQEKQVDDVTQEEQESSTIIITVEPTSSTREDVEIIEVIPKEVAQSAANDMTFSVQPIILEDDPVVMWQLKDVEETVELSYTVNKSVTTTGNTVALSQEGEQEPAPQPTKSPWEVIRPLLLIPLAVAAVVYLGRGHTHERYK